MSQHSSNDYAWKKIRQRVLERDGFTCVVCGQTATHVDHIYPKSRGGTDDMSNLQAMCRTHNLKKGNKVTGRSTYWDTTWFPNGLPTINN